MSIIGMTTSPEAFLAAEAEIAYSVMAHVTDYDVWHESEEPVTVEMVVRTLQHNMEIAREAVSLLVQDMANWEGEFAAHNAMRDALITVPSEIAPDVREKLELLVGKYL